MKEEALKLADELVELIVAPTPVDSKDACELIDESAIMIRRLVEELDKKPLSDDEIKELIVNKVTDYELCRAIEERHGIK